MELNNISVIYLLNGIYVKNRELYKVAHRRCLQFLDLNAYEALLMLSKESSFFVKKLSAVSLMIFHATENITENKFQFMTSEATSMPNSYFFSWFYVKFLKVSWRFQLLPCLAFPGWQFCYDF